MHAATRSRRRLRLAIVAAVVACLLPAIATTALASGNWGGGGSPPGSGSGGPTGPGYIVCKNGYGVSSTNGAKVYIPWYPRCNPGGYNRYRNQFTDRYCLVGFEVFRFYGIQGQSPGAWTRSQVGLPNWCVDSAQALMFAPNPQDSWNNGPAWNAWSGNNAQGQQYTVAGNGALTTNGPYERAGGCWAFNVGSAGRPADPLVKFFSRSDPAWGSQAYRDMRQKLYNHAASQRWSLGDAGALATINGRWTGSFPANADSIVYDDGMACSSDLDFASGAGDAPVEYGSCYIPIRKRASAFYDTWTGRTEYTYYVDAQGGTRYSDERAPGWKNFPNWRATMSSIIRWSGSAPIGAGYRGGATSNPANNGTPSMNNRQAAADYAYNAAVCFGGTGATFGTAGTKFIAPEVTKATVTVNAPQVFQVGNGSRVPQSVAVSATVSQLYCKNPNGGADGLCTTLYPAVGDQPTFKQVRFGLQVNGTNGYVQCPTINSTNCDFIITSTSTTPSPLGYKTTSEAEFFRATMPNQAITVTVTPSGEYNQPRTKVSNYQTCLNVVFPGNSNPVRDCITVPLSEKQPDQVLPIPKFDYTPPTPIKVISGTETAR